MLKIKRPYSFSCLCLPLLSMRNVPCPLHVRILLANKRSERDTIRGVQILAGAVYIYIYICMEVRVP